MHVVHHAHLVQLHHRGELCLCAVDGSRGISGFEVWIRTLDSGAHTETLMHGGELVVLALAGSGKLLIDGGPQRFSGPCTLLVPAQLPFQLVNNGSAPLQLVWVFTGAPTAVPDAGGPPMAPSSDAPQAAGDQTAQLRPNPSDETRR